MEFTHFVQSASVTKEWITKIVYKIISLNSNELTANYTKQNNNNNNNKCYAYPISNALKWKQHKTFQITEGLQSPKQDDNNNNFL